MDKKSAKTQKKQETQIVRNALKKTYKQLDERALEQTTRETMLAPKDRMIPVGGHNISASDLRQKVAQTIENLGSNPEQNLDQAFDLQMMVAHSLESINSETNSSQEYFRWLDDASDIIKNMNDGFVSQSDLDERNEFLEMSHQREAELLVCLSLYANSNSPRAAEQADLIRYKLKKLREMRSAIENTTRDKADVKVPVEEYQIAIPYYKLYKGLSKKPFGFDISSAQKSNLGINHDEDDDITDDRHLYDQMINAMLDDMRQDDYMTDSLTAFYTNEEEQKAMQAPDFKAEQKEKIKYISDKLKELTGRRRTFSVNYALLEARQKQMRG